MPHVVPNKAHTQNGKAKERGKYVFRRLYVSKTVTSQIQTSMYCNVCVCV